MWGFMTSASRPHVIVCRFEEHGGDRSPFLFKWFDAAELKRPPTQLLLSPGFGLAFNRLRLAPKIFQMIFSLMGLLMGEN